MESKPLFRTLGLTFLVIGFLICLLGFGDAVNTIWGSSLAFRGFAELLFGFSFLLLGNGFANLAKN